LPIVNYGPRAKIDQKRHKKQLSKRITGNNKDLIKTSNENI